MQHFASCYRLYTDLLRFFILYRRFSANSRLAKRRRTPFHPSETREEPQPLFLCESLRRYSASRKDALPGKRPFLQEPIPLL